MKSLQRDIWSSVVLIVWISNLILRKEFVMHNTTRYTALTYSAFGVNHPKNRVSYIFYFPRTFSHHIVVRYQLFIACDYIKYINGSFLLRLRRELRGEEKSIKLFFVRDSPIQICWNALQGSYWICGIFLLGLMPFELANF